MSSYTLRSERLREVAAEHGDNSGYAICRRTGLAQSTLSRLRRGLSRPSMQSLQKLADTYGVPFAELIEDRPATKASA